MAGFVDAEGCFGAKLGSSISINLSFNQKHRTALEALQRFFLAELGIQVGVFRCANGGYHSLEACHTSTAKICHKLLEAGLLQKKLQAELVLSCTTENGSEVRAKLQELKGNQGRFLRQDSEGITRALQIKGLQTRRSYLRRSPRIRLPEVANEVHELTVKIDELKKEHQQKELEREICAMHSHWEEVRRGSTLIGAGAKVESA